MTMCVTPSQSLAARLVGRLLHQAQLACTLRRHMPLPGIAYTDAIARNRHESADVDRAIQLCANFGQLKSRSPSDYSIVVRYLTFRRPRSCAVRHATGGAYLLVIGSIAFSEMMIPVRNAWMPEAVQRVCGDILKLAVAGDADNTRAPRRHTGNPHATSAAPDRQLHSYDPNSIAA